MLGSALASSPLLTEPLTGPVIVVGNPGGLPRIGLDLTGPLSMKLTGDFVTSPSAGLVFNGLPDIPIADFSLTFDQDRLVINLTSLCDGAAADLHHDVRWPQRRHSGRQHGRDDQGLETCGPPKGGKCKKKGKKKRKGKARPPRPRRRKRRSASARSAARRSRDRALGR